MSKTPPPPPPPSYTKTSTPTHSPLGKAINDYNRKSLNRVDNSLRGDAPELSARPGYEIADDEDKQLYFDTEEEVIAKVKQLALFVKGAKHMVAYTGAGISTSANIPDYRSPSGLWNVLAKGEKPDTGESLWDVVPTAAHMALAKLTELGILKFTVTTNLDGLHLRSGIPQEKLSELHGNYFKKVCYNCKMYFYILPELPWGLDKSLDLVLQSTCPKCHKLLKGTGVGFGSNLPQDEWEKAKMTSEACDLALVLGTSMRVAPSCNLPEKSYKNHGKLVICNLQKTPYDKYAALVIHAKTDLVMELLFKELLLTIPPPLSNLTLNPNTFGDVKTNK